MAYEQVSHKISAPAASDLSALQYTAVIFDTTAGGSKIAAATAAKNMDGILQDAPKSGQAGNVAIDGVSKAKLSGSVTAGDQLEIDTGGTFVTKASGQAIAKALMSGSSGDVISVLLYKSNGLYA
ncbi:MAG TPA: hypothetical protein VGN17_03955 [Bryobacteraceae bacterium]|jgi:hypothetical protein